MSSKESIESHGYWFDRGSLSCRCSECGCKNTKESDVCPHCNAIMDRVPVPGKDKFYVK